MPVWPVPGRKHTIPGGARGFGANRPNNRRHAGVDLYASRGDLLVATEPGRVVAHQGWAGPEAVALLFQTDSGPVVLYGAVAPGSRRQVGERLDVGDPIARVGRYPRGSSMLHLELYERGTTRNARWYRGDPQPGNLLNPRAYLEAAAEGRAVRSSPRWLWPAVAAAVAGYVAYRYA